MKCRRWLKATLTGLLAVAAVAAFWPVGESIAEEVRTQYVRPHVWAVRLAERTDGYRASADPLLSGLAGGRIRRGEPVRPLFAAHPPTRLTEYAGGEWVGAVYEWPGGGRTLEVVARDGALLSARVHVPITDSSCYLDWLVPMSRAEQAAFNAVSNAHLAAQAVLGADDTRHAAAAVAGPAATLEPDLWGKLARPAAGP